MATESKGKNIKNLAALDAPLLNDSGYPISAIWESPTFNNDYGTTGDNIGGTGTSFGRPEDYMELHISDLNGNILTSDVNFQNYKTVEATKDGLINSIDIDPDEILKNRGYNTGQYVLNLNILRRKIINAEKLSFELKDISASRTEIKAITGLSNKILDPAVSVFISELESSSLFKSFSLNFGQNLMVEGLNVLLNKKSKQHEIFIKLSNPLPNTISLSDSFNIVELLSDPYQTVVNLGDTQPRVSAIQLRGPNFGIEVDLDNSIPSDYKTYNDVLNYSLTSSYQHLLSRLENPEHVSIKYDYIRPVSSSLEDVEKTYHFENFVHFGSARDRLKNFKYKLELIEIYNSQSLNLNNTPGATSSSKYILENIENINNKKQNILKGFDGYERFLYYESGAYSWPKANSTPPFNLRAVSSSEAKIWYGDDKDSYNFYGGQLLSASLYDDNNQYSLIKTIPNHILDNPDNNFYSSFTNMVGQHFDQIWTYIKHITEINNTHHTRGISKDLVYFSLKSLGLETFDQFENTSLIEYILGEGTAGSNVYDTPANQTLITGSNEGSTPKGDISKEIWKRLYHNAPYLLKTKGTERGLRALMSCYGIPSTILNVKEYGGPTKNLDLDTTYKTFSYDKSGLALKGDSGTGGYFIKTDWSSSLTDALSASAKTVEFRIKPIRTTSQYHLFGLSGSTANNDPHLVLKPYTGNDISASGDRTKFGRLELYIANSVEASSSYFPVYNQDFWNIFIGYESTSGSNSTIKFGAYQSNWLKNTLYYTGSIFEQSEAARALTFGDPYSASAAHIGGASFAYFGGVEANPAGAYNTVDTLKYSGSLHEIKYHFGELLSHNTLKKHALEPYMYGGNTISSSYTNVVLRLPLGSNDQKDSSSFHPNQNIDYIPSSSILSNMSSQGWEETNELHHHITPDTVGISMTSEKVRIDSGSIDDGILSSKIKSETSTLDRQPQDFEDLGVFFSPTTELNEDIVYTLGGFRLDDYIGSPLPSAQTSSTYEDLGEINHFYFRKTKRRYNYTDYIKQIQYIDHTLFKLIKQWVPAKSNLKTGLLIEPHYLERTKFARELPIRSDGQTMVTGSHQTFEADIKGESIDEIYSISQSSVVATQNYKISGKMTGSNHRRIVGGTNAEINVTGYILDEPQQAAQAPIRPYHTSKPDGYIARQSNTFLGNAIKGRKSSKYFYTKSSGSNVGNYYIV
jgi:hypothetical protein